MSQRLEAELETSNADAAFVKIERVLSKVGFLVKKNHTHKQKTTNKQTKTTKKKKTKQLINEMRRVVYLAFSYLSAICSHSTSIFTFAANILVSVCCCCCCCFEKLVLEMRRSRSANDRDVEGKERTASTMNLLLHIAWRFSISSNVPPWH